MPFSFYELIHFFVGGAVGFRTGPTKVAGSILMVVFIAVSLLLRCRISPVTGY
jgi:hypothetical protein